MPANQSQTILVQSLRARLALDQGLGVDFVSVGAGALASLCTCAAPPPRSSAFGAARQPAKAAHPAEPVRSNAAAPRCTLVPYAPPPVNPQKEAQLAPLRAEAENCAACELHRSRTRAAWGEGSLDARVMFVGEAPGRDEDLEGRPFVGRAGMLLTDIIEKGMKLPRSAVYIANVVKCRPPGNRDPRPEELAACARYTERQFEIIRPEVVVAVGDVAGCALLGLPARTAGLRGKWHDFRGVPLRVIHRPSDLLRQRRSESDRTPADREVWADIQEVMRLLGG